MHVVFASIDGVVAHAGLRIKLNAGETWDAEDSLVKAKPELFTDQPQFARRTEGYVATPARAVETATRRPGQSRSTSTEKRSGAKPAASKRAAKRA